MKKKIAIIGSGIAGLTAANLFKNVRIIVAITTKDASGIRNISQAAISSRNRKKKVSRTTAVCILQMIGIADSIIGDER